MKMKMKMKRLLLSGVVLFAGWFTLTTQAQVNIGTNEEAVAGAILQLRDKPGVTDSTKNAYKGLAFPRVELIRANQLWPMFLSNRDNPAYGSTAEYETNKATLDKKHTGLVVYNLANIPSESLYPGLCMWDGAKWVSVGTNTAIGTADGKAVFSPISCLYMREYGEYREGVALDSATHYIRAEVFAIQPGAYSIKLSSANGYEFVAEGSVQTIDWHPIRFYARGTPKNAGEDTLTISGASLDCGKYSSIVVSGNLKPDGAKAILEPISAYAVGDYKKGKAMTTQNSLLLMVDVTGPGNYDIVSVAQEDGFGFSGTGYFPTAGTYTLRLPASGTPVKAGLVYPSIHWMQDAKVVQADSLFDVRIDSVLASRAITYAVIGTNPTTLSVDAVLSTYFWSSPGRRTALGSTSNFGPNGKVKVESLTKLWETSPSTASTYLRDGYGEDRLLPDIVLYNTYGRDLELKKKSEKNTITQSLAVSLAEYVKKGGCLIFGAASDASIKVNNMAYTDTMLRRIYGVSTSVVLPMPTGRSTTITTIKKRNQDNLFVIKDKGGNIGNDSLIIRGPFGKLDGQYWGEDNMGEVYLPSGKRPSTVVQIISAKTPTEGKSYGYHDLDEDDSIVWYDKQFNLFFIGDSSGSGGGSTGLLNNVLYSPAQMLLQGGIRRCTTQKEILCQSIMGHSILQSWLIMHHKLSLMC